MKTITLYIILFGITIGFANAQDINARKQKKEAKKLEALRIEDSTYKAVCALLKDKHFVLEADMVRNPNGGSSKVSRSNLNFIMVNSDTAIVQGHYISSYECDERYHSTFEGTITKYDLVCNDKKKSMYLHFVFKSIWGWSDIFITVSSNGYAESTELGFSGKIVPIDKSTAYEMPVY